MNNTARSDHSIAIIVTLGDSHYALASESIASIVSVPECTKLPRVPGWIRGLIMIRGQGYSLGDLRVRLGMPSLPVEIEEFVTMIGQREQDHVRWLDTLEACTREGNEFTLTTDPHKCAFGKWYDAYKTNNHLVELYLRRFDAPHKAIHAVGVEVDALIRSGDVATAQCTIVTTKNTTLAEMRLLFSGFRALIRETGAREVAILLNGTSTPLAVVVDSIDAVERFERLGLGPVSEAIPGLDRELVPEVGLWENGAEKIVIHRLEPRFLLK